MALKAILESLEGVNPDLAKEYKEVEQEGKKSYVLDLEGAYITDEPVDALKRARDYEKKEASTARQKAKDAAMAAEKLQEELDAMRRGAIPKGDVEKLELSWKEKLQKIATEKDSEITAARGSLQKLLVDNVAQQIAAKISNAPELILPHVKARLVAELTSDGYVTRVLDREGKASALSIEELQKDITNDKRFAPIIIGSKASGGGAAGATGDGTGSSASNGARKPDPKFNWNKATPKEIRAEIAARRAASGVTDTGD